MSAARHSLVWIRLIALVLVTGWLAACGGGGGSSVPVPTPTVLCIAPDPCVPLTVDNGPASFTGYNVNRLFTSVTICKSGTTACQTIDHVLVDTGSTGLRLLHSAVNPALNLTTETASSGQPLLNCVQFVDTTHAFGRVARADVILGPKTASNIPVQIVADPAYAVLSPACAAGPTLATVADLGANGILGVGLNKLDCGAYCVGTANNGHYYTCTSSACTAATDSIASLPQQVANPVPSFGSDNQGVVIDLPAVAAPGAPSIIGRMAFGIGTHASNTPAINTKSLFTNALGDITTVLSGGTVMAESFIDSGSNGLFFGINTLPLGCSLAPDFYCPAGDTPFTATVFGTNLVTASVPFVVGNANVLAATGYAALPTLAGPLGNNTSFDWGLPFFYGRTVFFVIEDEVTPLGTGPLYAF